MDFEEFNNLTDEEREFFMNTLASIDDGFYTEVLENYTAENEELLADKEQELYDEFVSFKQKHPDLHKENLVSHFLEDIDAKDNHLHTSDFSDDNEITSEIWTQRFVLNGIIEFDMTFDLTSDELLEADYDLDLGDEADDEEDYYDEY